MHDDNDNPQESLTPQQLEELLIKLPFAAPSRGFVNRVMRDVARRAAREPREYDLDAVAELSRQVGLRPDWTMAFQPIVDVERQTVVAHEALVRGPNNEPAQQVLERVNRDNICLFEELCRIKAVRLASELGMQTDLSINFPPRAFRLPDRTITATMAAAQCYGFPQERLIFEITRSEAPRLSEDRARLEEIVDHYNARGFRTAFDDFGPGFDNLAGFGGCRTDMVKLEMAMVRDIHKHPSRLALLRELLAACNDLGYQAVAKGVETYEEFDTLRELGVSLFQGFYFARPAFQSLASVPSSVYR